MRFMIYNSALFFYYEIHEINDDRCWVKAHITNLLTIRFQVATSKNISDKEKWLHFLEI